MFGWRKKRDAFEWRKYVPTALVKRRQQRRKKIESVKQGAAAQARAAGRQAQHGAKAGAAKVGHGVSFTAAGLLEILARPAVAGPLSLAGLIAVAAAAHRWRLFGTGRDTLVPLIVGSALLAASLPALTALRSFRVARLGRGSALTLGAAAALVAGLGWLANAGPNIGRQFRMPALSTFSLLPSAQKPIEGRAQAASGDTLKVGATTVRLAGVEAPLRDQKCGKGAKKAWRCGEAARAAMERAVRGKRVVCDPGKVDGEGLVVAACRIDDRDLAAELLRGGHIFATGGFLTQYGRLESAARDAKAGIWSGDVERPSDARAKLASNTRR